MQNYETSHAELDFCKKIAKIESVEGKKVKMNIPKDKYTLF